MSHKGISRKRAIGILLAFVAIIIVAETANTAAARSFEGGTQLSFWMVPGPMSGNSVDLTLNVMSVGGPKALGDFNVTLTPCELGQQTPFALIGRTRHLTGSESLVGVAGNHVLVWANKAAGSAPNGRPTILHLRLALPTDSGGPFICVRAAAFSPQSANPQTPYVQIYWYFDAPVK